MLVIHQDDLSGDATRALLALHLSGMHENTPAGHVFALDLSGLQAANVTVWSAWDGEAIAGIGALKELGGGTAEVKSMRTHPEHLRKGVGGRIAGHDCRVPVGHVTQGEHMADAAKINALAANSDATRTASSAAAHPVRWLATAQRTRCSWSARPG